MLKFLCDIANKELRSCPLEHRFSKKQQAIADREQELLQIALQLVEAEGYANLTMDKLTAASPYSKGTIYNHFSSKEDVITALCNAALRQEISLFKKAELFNGSSREKALALHQAYLLSAKMQPILFNCVLTAKSPWVQEKSSIVRLTTQQELEKEISGMVDLLLQQAIEANELQPKAGATVDLMAFANWAISFGGIALLSSASETYSIERLQGAHPFLFNLNCMLDGMNWLPLSADWDYCQSWLRIEKEIFSTEQQQLATSLPQGLK
ncbi:TetR/AcrR family transcriptional regulator [Rheinheimera faecalis]|uniref:TetR/AcrR family transcriptional regulator n=1 Tax=Rheinheimera faecalis TaxID=2901141 RepID=UPI001E61224D|nr:TetR/AcrR family transcriptional regulator [Rheinheimera faecalis]